MAPFSLFLALKYLKPQRSFVSVVTLISIMGVVLGVAVMIVVLSIMTGFDDMWFKKIIGFNSHLTVMSRSSVIENQDEIVRAIGEVKGVTHATPHVQTIVLMRNGERMSAPMILGLPTDASEFSNEIPKHLVEGAFDISDDKIVLGSDLAASLDVGVGDTVLVYSPKSVVHKDEVYLPEELVVSGIFELGMWEFDSRFGLSSIELARDLYGIESGALGIRVMTDDPLRAPEYKKSIVEHLGSHFYAYTWMDMNRSLFDALRVEKGVMFLILLPITVVAIFSIVSIVIVVAVQKTSEIGLLKAIGFSRGQIMGVFIWYGLIQCIIGTVTGILSGLLFLHYRTEIVHWLSQTLGVDLFPKSIYQLAEIPSRTAPGDVAIICVAVVALCTLASMIPAARSAKLNPVEALRNE